MTKTIENTTKEKNKYELKLQEEIFKEEFELYYVRIKQGKTYLDFPYVSRGRGRIDGKGILDSCNNKGYFNIKSDKSLRRVFKGDVTALYYVGKSSEKNILQLSFQDFLRLDKKTNLLKKVTETLE